MLIQSQSQNYIKTTNYKVSSTSSLSNPTAAQATQNIIYFDGLGRPNQERAHRQSGTGTDLVTHISYDGLGRQTKDYLPYPTTTATLAFDTNAEGASLNYYNASQPLSPGFETTGNPFSEKLFENSPLNRVIKQAAPGNSWATGSGHEIKTEYSSNIAGEVRSFSATAIWQASQGLYTSTLVQQAEGYAAGQLYKTVIKNENWTSGTLNTTEEFKDKEGRIILKKTYAIYNLRGNKVIQPMETYYVYNQFGNLAFVLPPLLSSPITLTQIDGLCYQYRYDKRNRLVEKKLPGKQWEFIVYDNLDRIIATGPTFSPFSDIPAGSTGWLITKYDEFDRIAYTGWMPATVTSNDRNTLQIARHSQTSNLSETKSPSDNNVNGVVLRYTNLAWPATGYHILTVNYYDDYNFPNAPSSFGNVEGDTVYYNLSIKPKGLSTGSWTRALQTSTIYTGETSYILYDKKARAIQKKTMNYLGGYTRTDNKLDFSGKTLYTITYHKRTTSDAELKVREDYTYSDQDRLLTLTHTINTGIPQLLAKNEYNNLGQLVRKNVGGTDISGNSAFQKIDYAYNVRNWLKEINNTTSLTRVGDPTDLFAFKIYYDSPIVAQPLFNGNITETEWKTASDNKIRKYSYSYDAVNRLTNAVYIKENRMTESYNESIQYDKNGNITILQRNGGLDSDSGAYVQIDDLFYSYDGQNRNRITSIEDNTGDPQGFKDGAIDYPEYFYDANGNMTQDLNKGITEIRYNHMNLPIKIVFGSESNKIEYLYDATGTKIKKTITGSRLGAGGTVDYLGGFQYKNNLLEFFPTAEGYVRATLTSTGGYAYSYVFNFTDHLGNIRLSYAENPQNPGTLSILEENHYYPFGLKHTNYNSDQLIHQQSKRGVVLKDFGGLEPVLDPLPYNYKYNRKEWQDELGLNFYDYGARNYDPAIGRWMNIDPLAEEYRRWSPYNYCIDNPIRFVDPDGMGVYDWIKNNKSGKFEWRNEVTSSNNTPVGYTYIGKNDNSIIHNLFGALSSKASTRDMGLIAAADFDNPYSAKGVAFHNAMIKTELMISITADVKTEYNQSGEIKSKEFRGVNFLSTIIGNAIAPYPDVNISLKSDSMTLQGNKMKDIERGPHGNILPSGGNVPSLNFQSYWNASSIQKNFGKSFELIFNFTGQYSNGNTPISYPGAAGLSGIPNPTSVSATINFNNTANPTPINPTRL